jgi:hypothetical protein
VHAAAVPEEEHHRNNEAPSASFLARLQSQKSHTHAFARLSEPPGLTLGLEEAENVILTDCRFLVLASRVFRGGVFGIGVAFRTRAHDGAGGVVHELDADLGHATAGA